MAPIVKTLPSYIMDSQHALEIFRDFNFHGKTNFRNRYYNSYTVISNDEGPQTFFRSMHCYGT